MLARLISIAKKLDDVAEVVLLKVLAPAARKSALQLVCLAALVAVWIAQAPAPVAAPAASAVATSAPAPLDGAFLLDRAWIDNPRANARDKFSLWFFSDHPRRDKERTLWTVYQHGAPARAVTEFFAMKPEGCKLHLRSLWNDKRHEVHFAITHERHGRADLKLTVKKDPHHGGEDHVYWSRMDKWRGRGGEDVYDPGTVARALIAMPDAE